MGIINELRQQLSRINAELNHPPPLVDDYRIQYQYRRRAEHLRREHTRLLIQIELERANYWTEL